jgi:hypothetical protein
MTTRDPRRDPRPGDVLQSRGDRFMVTAVIGGRVCYTRVAQHMESLFCWGLTMDNATVLHAAPEADQ